LIFGAFYFCQNFRIAQNTEVASEARHRRESQLARMSLQKTCGASKENLKSWQIFVKSVQMG
jgi:hypothetical protein